MSCFTYYGKLKDELFVAVLPNGTVEIDDPVELFSQKQLMPFRVKDVSITDDGEDRFTFHDGYYAFEGVTSKAYKSINLTRKTISTGETSSIALTRQYEQPRTATPQDGLKIWTGTISFHEWANNESFVVVAPKGVGKDMPIVALWQWTKDAKGTPKTLSCGTSKQISDATSPEKFSFKQNDYYTLVCQVNTASKGLKVTVKGPTNGDKEQKELTWAPTGRAGAEHRFSPPRDRQEKIALDCSFPNAKPSLPRITGALPFPADLVDTLSYSAAYLDQAGYLAKYAVKQFEKLDRSYHLLEKKAEARAAKIVKLEGDNSLLKSDNENLKKRNVDLEKQIDDNRKEAASREAGLEEKLRKALAALKASESKAEKLEKENGKLKKHIAKDLCEDIEREARHRAHDEADHKAIDLANEALREAQDLGKQLKEELDCKNSIIAALEANLDASKCQLGCAEADIVRLKGELAIERQEKMDLLDKNDDLEHRLYNAEQDLKHLRTEIANTKAELAAEQKKNVELNVKLSDTECKLTKALSDAADARSKLSAEQKKSADLSAKLEETESKLNKAVEDANDARSELTSLQRRFKELKEENTSIHTTLKETKDRANAADDANSDLYQKLKDSKTKHEAELEALKNKFKHLSVQQVKSDITATVAEVTI